MHHHGHTLQLIWDVDKFRCHVGDIEIAIATMHFPPFDINAVVEEQDTSLVLGETDEIRDPGEKPAWYLANLAEAQSLLSPGHVIIRDTHPLRLQAIVHDLDQEPICRETWIILALQQIMDITEKRKIQALQMPLLGTRYGGIEIRQFLDLLLVKIANDNLESLNKLWLVSPEQQCQQIFEELNEAITCIEPK